MPIRIFWQGSEPVMHKRLTVCIPAYNRANRLVELLDSIVAQDYTEYEILICEDNSPERREIAQIVREYQARYPDLIRYYENERNLGYDGQIRNLVNKAEGDYCFFMGNDDLMAPRALATVGDAVDKYENIGVVLRTYASFDEDPEKPKQVFRYFEQELFFPGGRSTIITFFRRSVVISGLVLHTLMARKFTTDKFDGTLLYQLYLSANILVSMNGVSLPRILALYREGGTPDFGNSESEKGKFVPRMQTPESSVHFMKGMLDIARHVEKSRKIRVFKAILKDIGNYSYPILAIQAGRSLPVYLHYAYKLSRLGLYRSGMFFLYFFLILILRPARIERLIVFIKSILGHTPKIGNLYSGRQN
ncbi:MAG: glycosyltransferase family 2 protein [Spirochaetales bacterium]|nr:glycosyltransferase family 2 protein [Spirochaetales bacterium]